ncbi:hypothetical protein FJU10_16770 [Enterococcus sp. OL5]|nr:hypothetical protein FJU10_16770 [Enterococcus sp. OL5]
MIQPLSEIHYEEISAVTQMQLRQSEWVFFTSQAAVKPVLAVVPRTIKIAVIGESTAQAVRGCGFDPTFISSIPIKEEMLLQWQQEYPQKSTISYPKSQLANQQIEQLLSDKHDIYSFIAYTNTQPKGSSQEIHRLLRTGQIACVYLTSPSAWHRFYPLLKKYPETDLTILTIGETTAKAVRKRGYEAIIKGKWHDR